MEYEGLTRDDLDNVYALNAAWLAIEGGVLDGNRLSERRRRRLATTPFLLFMIGELVAKNSLARMSFVLGSLLAGGAGAKRDLSGYAETPPPAAAKPRPGRGADVGGAGRLPVVDPLMGDPARVIEHPIARGLGRDQVNGRVIGGRRFLEPLQPAQGHGHGWDIPFVLISVGLNRKRVNRLSEVNRI